MMSASLLAMFCAIYAICQIRLARRDLFFGVAYFYLFLYAIFALIGYIYLPDLSDLIWAYFGPDVVVPALVFLSLSFLGIYLALSRMSRLCDLVPRYIGAGRVCFDYLAATSVIVGLFLAVLCSGLVAFWDELSYANASDLDFIEDQGVSYMVWAYVFKMTVFVLTALYSIDRTRIWEGRGKQWILRAYFLALATTFTLIAYRLGNRTDLVALFNGLLFVELCRTGEAPYAALRKAAPRIALFTLPIALYLGWIEGIRSGVPVPVNSWYEGLLLKDYYAPAHMLFAAINFNLVDPIEVLTSNFSNSLVLMIVPYLQEFVTSAFNPPTTISRAASYAFYVLTEGYLFMGPFGFVYNAVVISSGLVLWRLASCTSSMRMNCLILPLLAVHLANLARGQNSYFVKYYYMTLIPAFLFVFLSTGYYISLRKREAA